MRLILVSTSERRRQILALLGLPFEVVAPRFEESPQSHLTPEAEAISFATEKVRSVAAEYAECILIGCDTLIALQDNNHEHKIGKPHSPAEAQKILETLSGKTHTVISAVTLIAATVPEAVQFTATRTAVTMKPYGSHIISTYVKTGEGLDKAGAYALQGEGRHLIDRLEGDYLSAVGLPLKPIAEFLRAHGVTVPVDVEALYQQRNFLNWRSYQPVA